MTTSDHAAGVPRPRTRSRSRLLSATAFAGAVLAFALPFGTVESCDGEKVSFTGAELATYDVQAGGSGTLHEEVEHNTGVFAAALLLAAVLGFVCVLGGMRGGGVFASLGLVAAQLLGFAVLVSGDAGATLLGGFWLALGALAVAGVVHLVASVRARRRAGRRAWIYVLVRCCIALSPTLGVVVVIGIALLVTA